MTVTESESYLAAPLYTEALQSFQRGDWGTGLEQLNTLVEKYPLDNELRSLRQEMQLRARIDEYEEEDKSRQKQSLITRLLIRLVLLAIILTGVFWVGANYFSWFQQQLFVARGNIEEEVENIATSIKYRNAQNLYLAGRLEEAKTLFEEVEAAEPEFPGLAYYLTQVDDSAAIEKMYLEAVAWIDSGHSTEALAILEEIETVSPYYKNVPLLLDNVKRDLLLDDILLQADIAFRQKDWEEAITGYTSLLALDPDYRTEYIEEQLFNSFLDAAEEIIATPTAALEDLLRAETYFRKALALKPRDEEALQRRAKARYIFEENLFWRYVEAAHETLAGQSDSLDALTIAEGYFRAALKLRPGHEQIAVERELARLYLRAQANFAQSRWNEVIADMEDITERDADYAMGTARQTLYEAYLVRGDGQAASGQYEAALSDYQRAAVLAQQKSETVMNLYEVQIRIAAVHATLGNYENAVRLLQSAMELSGLRDRADQDDPAIALKLADADVYLAGENFQRAYRLYKEALSGIDTLYETITHIVVEGEYLTLIASRYRSTVSAIVEINDIANPNKIYVGQELLVPVFDKVTFESAAGENSGD